MIPSLQRRCAAEGIGTAFLLATVVGSGIMAERLAGGNIALALLANSTATGAGLAVYILVFGPISGAHFNPAVTLASAVARRFPWREVPAYVSAQVIGALLGVMAAHTMFGESPLVLSTHARSGSALCFAEAVATFGLLCVVIGVPSRLSVVAPAVGAYIASAYWFTASTSFANPAVTFARAFTNTFTGIRLVDLGGFVLAQLIGAIAATLFLLWVQREVQKEAPQ